MGAEFRSLVEHIEKTWTPDEQAELVAIAYAIEDKRKGVYILSDEEREAVEEGLAQAERGEFATDEELEADRRRFGL